MNSQVSGSTTRVREAKAGIKRLKHRFQEKFAIFFA
jgi:hypothetical protein